MIVPLARPGIRKIGAHMINEDPGDFPPPRMLLNSNESAFGACPQAIAAAREATGSMERYYENVDQALTPRIAAFFELDAAKITIGNGSDDLLARLARAYLGPGTEMLRSENGYPKAPNYAYANDAEVRSVPDENFKPSLRALIEGINPRTRMIYLANPENPAGTYLTNAEIQELHDAMPQDALLVLDNAYEEYIDAPDHVSARDLVDKNSNVVMSRTFSKIFGLAGARVGWMYAASDVIDNVRRISTTFPISGPSMAAALAALEDRAHYDMVYEANREGRRYLSDSLAALGLAIVPSQTNFVLVGFPDTERCAIDADHYLRMRGIAIRRFSGAAFQNYLRITIGAREDLAEVVAAIRDYLLDNQPPRSEKL